MKHNALKLIAFLLSTVTWPGLLQAAERHPDRPNLIVFIADDIGWDDYGCYGNPAARTPNIDAIAKKGRRYTQAFLTASSCSPSRSSIITGRYPHNLGPAAELHLSVSPNIPWVSTVLRNQGYYTALIGKNHMSVDFSSGTPPFPKRWDLVDQGRVPENSGLESKRCEILQHRPKDRPFFFWLAAGHREPVIRLLVEAITSAYEKREYRFPSELRIDPDRPSPPLAGCPQNLRSRSRLERSVA